MELHHLCVRSTSKAPVVAVVAGRVLQAEAGLVSLSHTGVSAGVQQVVMAEFVHAVVVPVDTQTTWSTPQAVKAICLDYIVLSINKVRQKWSPNVTSHASGHL